MDKICQRFQESFGIETAQPELIEHSLHCPTCQDFANRMGNLHDVLPSWQIPPVSADFDINVMAQIAEYESQRNHFWKTLSSWMQFRISIPAPAGAMVILLLGFSMYFNIETYYKEIPQGGVNLAQQNLKVLAQNKNPLSNSLPPIKPDLVVHSNDVPSLLSEFNGFNAGVGIVLVLPQLPTTPNYLNPYSDSMEKITDQSSAKKGI